MTGELVGGGGFVIAAYGVVWTVLLVYGAYLWRRSRRDRTESNDS